MGYPDRRHISFDEKVKILEEKVTVTKSVFITVNNGEVRAMIEIAKKDYGSESEAGKVIEALIGKLEQSGKIGAPMAMAYKMLLAMK
jgi:hypothetical protein